MVWVSPAWGAIAQPDRLPLTLPLLQERLRSPIQTEGVRTIDFQRLIIDLRPENAEFREQFYRLLRELLRSQPSLGLNLSYSLVLGDFQISDVGVRTPLFGQSSLPLLSQAEQTQLQRDRRRIAQFSQLSRSLLIQNQSTPLQLTVVRSPLTLVQTRFENFANFTNTYFLDRVEASGAIFNQEVDWSDSRFGKLASFAGANFRRDVRFRNSIFFDRARFSQAQFQGAVILQGSEFRAAANFGQARFQQVVNASRVQWRGTADFAQTRWQERALFTSGTFDRSLFLTEATFEKFVSFRQVQFKQPANLRGTTVLDQMDFGDAGFAATAYLNVADLQFNAEKATILGNPGELGRVLSVPSLQGNETLLRNLVRNFRLQEQISDANRVEYTREILHLRQLRQRLVGTNLNTASIEQLQRVGFSDAQAIAILNRRDPQSLNNLSDLLNLPEIDLATYVKVRDRVVAEQPDTFLGWLGDGLQWIRLLLLLSLSRYGTSFGLIFGVGMVGLAYFGIVFWSIDRVRRFYPKPIVPRLDEATWMLTGAGAIALLGISAILRTAANPWLTLGCISFLAIPVPTVLLVFIYQQGRYHDLMSVSYFVEDGSLRQFRLLIGRLPTIPKFPLFRDRYTPILWDRRWNWLNYLDFSLNNLLKFGFNDIRLRDEHMPGLVTALAWYEWMLGLLYLALLLWTLSRTIPGLNLLIYFK